MNRWICLGAAAAALLFAGCDKGEDGGAEGSGRPVAASSGESAALADPSSPDMLPAARRTAQALTGAADERGDGAGRRLFDGAAERAGFPSSDASGTVYAPAYSGAGATLVRYQGKSRKISDLGRGLPPVDAAAVSARLAAGGAGGSVLSQFEAFVRSCYADSYGAIDRAGWRASRRRGAAVAMRPTHVTVHHTEGPQTMTADATAQAVKNIQSFHMANADGRHGWDDIGYHFLIDGAGRVVEGRPAETLGAHAGGANDQNIGISMMGDFNRQKPTDAQVESLTRLVSFLAMKYGQDPSRTGFLEPHKHYDQTDCPGHNMMAILDALRRRVDARTAELVARLHAAKPGEFVPMMTTDA